MREVRALLRGHSFSFALALAIALLIANLLALPNLANPTTWPRTLAIFAPFALVAIASTPSIVSGGGGLDLSVAPLANFLNVLFVSYLLPHGLGDPAVSIPILLVLGTAIGALNGVLVAVLRYQPVIATLCVLFILNGLNLKMVEAPVSASANWTSQLSGMLGPVPGALVLIGAPMLIWFFLQRTAYHRTLFAVGGDDVTAFSVGVDVVSVRILAYALGGLFAAIAGISFTALFQSADPGLSTQYILIAIAAVVLGGTPVGGGRGGLLGSILGAACIFLVQSLLSYLQVSTLWLQVAYGGLLLTGVVVGALVK